jgi:hypothetical protein
VDAISNPDRKRPTVIEILRLNIRAAKVALHSSLDIYISLIMHYLQSIHEINAYRPGCVYLHDSS